MFRWLSQCIPGFSTIFLVVLLVFAFGDINLGDTEIDLWGLFRSRDSSINQQHSRRSTAFGPDSPELKFSQKVIIFYSIFVHLNTVAFALRLCFSIQLVTNKIRATFKRRQPFSPRSCRYADSPPQYSGRDQGGLLSQAGPDSILPMRDEVSPSDEVVHAIIVPNYGEDVDTLGATLAVLASHPRAATQYEVYLAMEQKEANSAVKASVLISEYEKNFLDLRATFHPSNLPGEIAGKSSNVAHAARNIFEYHKQDKNRADVIITVMDSDTHLLQDYFTEIRSNHVSSPDSARALYVSPIVFDRNAHETNILTRIADILWGGAGLAGYLPWASIHIPTSVYSLPLPLAEEVGGWDGDPNAIGEDMHMLLKVYFSSRGTVVTVPVYSPASQCNISSTHAVGWRRDLGTIRARYRQALRHMWGSLDFGYAVRRAVQTHALRWSHIPLFHLLWEAHLLPCHFIIVLVAVTLYIFTHDRSQIHPALLWTFWFTAALRNGSFVVMQLAFSLYDRYHALCVNARASDMQQAGIVDMFAFRRPLAWNYLAERIVFPVVAVLYSGVPALHAQACHFWTNRLVYHVSVKPTLAPAVPADEESATDSVNAMTPQARRESSRSPVQHPRSD